MCNQWGEKISITTITAGCANKIRKPIFVKKVYKKYIDTTGTEKIHTFCVVIIISTESDNKSSTEFYQIITMKTNSWNDVV